jgi:serine/threonine-protein kinase RsbW
LINFLLSTDVKGAIEMESNDKITLLLPCKAEYVSVARLTASGVACRMGYDIDTVEDIKVAVSEVCSRIINVGGISSGDYEITYEVYEDRLVITFATNSEGTDCLFENDEDGLGMSIINAFMDEVEFCPEEHNLTMTKYIGEKS